MLGGGGIPAVRNTPDNRDSLTEEDTARAAVKQRVSGIARHMAGVRHREAESAPDAQRVTPAG